MVQLPHRLGIPITIYIAPDPHIMSIDIRQHGKKPSGPSIPGKTRSVHCTWVVQQDIIVYNPPEGCALSDHDGDVFHLAEVRELIRFFQLAISWVLE
jgi:hypothetical protein